MTKKLPLARALSVALALAIASPVLAQSKAPTPEQRKQLDAARAELDKAARHMAELSRKYGAEDGGPQVWIRKPELRTPVVGILLAPDDKTGVRIAGVTPDGAAAEAGLRSGDQLVGIDGHAVLGTTGETRLENARKLLTGLDEKTAIKLDYMRDGRKATVSVKPRTGRNVMFFSGADGAPGARIIELDKVKGDASKLHNQFIRIERDKDCKDEDCGFPMLAEALRWNGLNLASVDGRLGRYFGTDQGVLVLSSNKDLAGLEPGDVIRKIDGKPVSTPREAMDVLRGRKTGSQVAVEYLRDRKAATARIKVPEARAFRLPPPPPAPPAPPAPPLPPGMKGGKAMAPHAIEHRKIVWVDDKGKRHEIEDDGTGPLPPDVMRARSKDGKSVEKRKLIFVDDAGHVQTWEDDEDALPPPPPVAPPPPPPPAPPAPAN